MELFRVHSGEENFIPILMLNEDEWGGFEKDQLLLNTLKTFEFSGRSGQTLLQLDPEGNLIRVFAGTTFPNEDPRNWITLFASVHKALPEGMLFHPEGLPEDRWYEAMLGWGLAKYRFDGYKSKPKKGKCSALQVPQSAPIKKVEHTLESVFMGRDLINTPANHLIPSNIVAKVKTLAKEFGAEITAFEGADLLLENLPTVYAVGKGSANPPAFVDLQWGDPSHPKLVIIGKGVVFDTGGQNLKPAAGMRNMKKDMGGAAVAISLANLIMQENLPVRLRLMVPTVENMPGWKAYRPGDVIKTRKGIQVEIGNTDAEGRLILCDALAMAVEEENDLIIDFATLTGSARMALGEDLPACYSPDDDLMEALVAASKDTRDPVWHMPLWEPYARYLKSDVADMDNVANTPLAGSVTAALYLWEFVKPFKNWIHLDIFGWRNTSLPGYPKGGEASALRAVFRFLENRYRK